MTCKECIHDGVCWTQKEILDERECEQERECCEPKSRFVELPCEVGQTVYQVLGFSIHEYKITQIRFDDLMMWFYCENEEYAVECRNFLFDITRIGRTVLLSREEAEKALAERKEL